MRFAFLLCFTTCCFFTGAAQKKAVEENVLRNILAQWPAQFDSIMQHSKQYRLQIAYTQVTRDAQNKPTLKTYTVGIDSYYYYCASTIKLLEAPLAIEKVNRLKGQPVSIYDSLYIPEFYCSGLNDWLLRRRYKNSSLAQFIKEMFLVSNNESFNPLYDFLTQEYFNTRLKDLGVKSAVICGRFAPCDSNENRQSDPVEFYNRTTGELKYTQPSSTSKHTFSYCLNIPPLVGKGVMQDGTITNKPRDFSYNNYIKLSELHKWMIRLMLPETQAKDKKLQLADSDYVFIRKYMGMFPRESVYPVYDPKDNPDNKMKYYVHLDSSGVMPANIRIFNKIGEAYGFVTDCSYVVDTLNKVEFFLTTSIYVNKDEILNDNVYEYETVAHPFFENLFSAIYLHEITRNKKYKPKLAPWNFTDNVY